MISVGERLGIPKMYSINLINGGSFIIFSRTNYFTSLKFHNAVHIAQIKFHTTSTVY